MLRPPQVCRCGTSTVSVRGVDADVFERFFATKFPSSKRFGIEGCESIMPALHAFCQHASAQGVQRIEVGMSHRGRLNILHNLLDKPVGMLCSEMEGHQSNFRVGDVKYHLGQTVKKRMEGGVELAITVAPNPSHLEMSLPVVQGLVRALQRHRCAPHCHYALLRCVNMQSLHEQCLWSHW
jgi:2-oxoglutarate dehydrogenase E1 component